MLLDILYPEDGALDVLGLLAIGVIVMLDDRQLVLHCSAVLSGVLVVLQHVVQTHGGAVALGRWLAGLSEHLLSSQSIIINYRQHRKWVGMWKLESSDWRQFGQSWS